MPRANPTNHVAEMRSYYAYHPPEHDSVPTVVTRRAMQRLLAIITGPVLKQTYISTATEAKSYVPNGFESMGDLGLKISVLVLKLGLYTSPVSLVMYLKNNGLVRGLPEPPATLVTIVTLLGMLMISSFVSRFLGRILNPEYVSFANSYAAVMNSDDKETLNQFLSVYDFDFRAWPVAFRFSDVERDEAKPRQFLAEYQRKDSWVSALPCSVARYIIAHTVGIRLLYPGTVMSSFLEHHLLNGRGFLMLSYGGKRAKVETKDGNHIDTMFVDRRKKSENGNILVLCCEGNAGFYEIGIMGTPLEGGYSVLGWNHPGFGGSTGLPHPTQELNAADAVMQYAKHQLGFRPEQIIVYAWSIGGFSSSWLVMNNPDVRAIIVDASFDDVSHLAKSIMPDWLSPLVTATVKNYLNLNNAEQLKYYPGPVRFVRRTLDEVICSTPGDLGTNRGNDLALKVLTYRYPKVFTPEVIPAVRKWFGLLGVAKNALTYEECAEYFEGMGELTFPAKIGEDWDKEKRERVALFLLAKHVTDFDRTHCIPLPSRLFMFPWDVKTPKVN